MIELEEVDPTAVKLMLHYLYHGDYMEESPTTEPLRSSGKRKRSSSAKKNDPKHRKTGMQPSSSTATDEKPPPPTTPAWLSDLILHARLYALGDMYDIPGLRKTAASKFKTGADRNSDKEEYLEAAVEAYSCTPETDRTLRDLVVETLVKAPGRCLLMFDSVKEVIRGCDGLSFDLLMALNDKCSGACTRRNCVARGLGNDTAVTGHDRHLCPWVSLSDSSSSDSSSSDSSSSDSDSD